MAFLNPVLRGWNPDPSVCRVGADYYLATSTFMYAPGVPIYHSTDLINWSLIGHALSHEGSFDFSRPGGKNQIFAPTLRWHAGRFYLVTTDVNGIGNFMVSAENPAGPWSDPVVIDTGLFDPSLLFDDDGTVYYTRRGKTGISQARLDIPSGRLLEKPREIARGFVTHDTEGPHLYHIGDFYYLLTAEGGSRYGHMATIGRSRSPWGPFEPCPHNPILTQRHITFSPIRDTGHGELVEDADGAWWLFFLGTRNWSYSSFAQLGRETFLLPVCWTDDGWPLVGDGGRAATLVGGTGTGILDERVRNEALLEETDDWTGPKLDGRWITIRRPSEGSVHPGGDGLKLACLPGGLCAETPVLLARRLTAFDFEAELTVTLEPSLDWTNDGAEATEAGICLYLDRNHWYAAGIASSSKLVLRKRIEDMEMVAAELPLVPGTNTVRLGIRGHDEGFEFLWALPGQKEWQLLGTASARLLWPELASVWTGTVIGVWASQNRESDLLQQKTESETLASEAPFALFKAWSYRETLARWWKMDGSIPRRLTDGDEE